VGNEGINVILPNSGVQVNAQNKCYQD
jgi:hypothetical protein